MPFHQENAPCNKLMKIMPKIQALHFDLPLHSPDFAPIDLSYLTKMLQENRFVSNREVIAQAKTYFMAKLEALILQDHVTYHKTSIMATNIF